MTHKSLESMFEKVISSIIVSVIAAWFVMVAIGILASKGAISWTLSYWESYVVWAAVNHMTNTHRQKVEIVE